MGPAPPMPFRVSTVPARASTGSTPPGDDPRRTLDQHRESAEEPPHQKGGGSSARTATPFHTNTDTTTKHNTTAGVTGRKRDRPADQRPARGRHRNRGETRRRGGRHLRPHSRHGAW